ncbi:hypothetical protein Bpfe_000192 [Biomphalaria pfeifferi]|uniref:Uncharacterized protein n=1 Tax=Biomphalaria pfeifferi TaxID=112525 RepID=A0AAD8CDQ0_BIOPF|nr:hypothetical protein Bpfe_000192 [Biomphalaria pfeifferi]
MEALIRSQNFAHDDERAWTTFQTSVDDLPDNQIDERGMDDVIQSLEALADKLTADSKPAPKTKGWQMAHYALEKIIYIVW